MTGNHQTAKSLPELTKKQRDVLALVADNRTSKEIAARLGISESAVNQRIEMVRARLGGLPRGELARLYRQEFAPQDEVDPAAEPIWQKIHLPDSARNGQEGGAEGISLPRSGGSQLVSRQSGDGSQLSAFFFEQDRTWLGREDRTTVLARRAAIVLIVAASLGIAMGVTQLLGPIGGG